jgi:hypothetical protein
MRTQTIERNYRTHAHTARFLQVFHSGIGTNGVNYREGIVTETQALELEANQDADLLDEVEELEVVDLRTPGQRRFMDDLVARLTALDPATGEAAREYTERGTREGAWTPGREGNASRWINRMISKEAELKAQGRKAPQPTATEVPDGRYAVEEDGTLKFFHIRNGKANTRWAGFVFVDIQASDDLYPLKDRARKARVLAAIAADLETASRRYGQELGVCGRCGRTLTDEESRAYGIGPVCRGK